MSEQYSLFKKRVFEGVEVLRYRINLDIPTDKEEISEFYRGVYDKVLLYCETELCRYSEEKYTLCELPRKKFTYPPLRYRLEGVVTYNDGETMFVKLTASAGNGEGLSALRYDAHAWSLSEQCLLPPRMAARAFLGGRIPKDVGKNGFLIENGRPFICYPDRLLPITREVKSKKTKTE